MNTTTFGLIPDGFQLVQDQFRIYLFSKIATSKDTCIEQATTVPTFRIQVTAFFRNKSVVLLLLNHFSYAHVLAATSFYGKKTSHE